LHCSTVPEQCNVRTWYYVVSSILFTRRLCQPPLARSRVPQVVSLMIMDLCTCAAGYREGARHVEVSALTGDGVEDLFSQALEAAAGPPPGGSEL
jgi:hypothetical protein